eukprot:scaffold25080_cov21-Tisochrysis_lutea.AAC.1
MPGDMVVSVVWCMKVAEAVRLVLNCGKEAMLLSMGEGVRAWGRAREVLPVHLGDLSIWPVTRGHHSDVKWRGSADTAMACWIPPDLVSGAACNGHFNASQE